MQMLGYCLPPEVAFSSESSQLASAGRAPRMFTCRAHRSLLQHRTHLSNTNDHTFPTHPAPIPGAVTYDSCMHAVGISLVNRC